MNLLQDLIIMLLSAAVILIVTARLKIPSILGFLLEITLSNPDSIIGWRLTRMTRIVAENFIVMY